MRRRYASLEHVYFEEELDAQRRMVQSRFPVALLSEVTGGKLERAMRCREITAPIGLGYEVFSIQRARPSGALST